LKQWHEMNSGWSRKGILFIGTQSKTVNV